MAEFPVYPRNYMARRILKRLSTGLPFTEPANTSSIGITIRGLTRLPSPFVIPNVATRKSRSIHKFGIFGFAEIGIFLETEGFTQIRTTTATPPNNPKPINTQNRLVVSGSKSWELTGRQGNAHGQLLFTPPKHFVYAGPTLRTACHLWLVTFNSSSGFRDSPQFHVSHREMFNF